MNRSVSNQGQGYSQGQENDHVKVKAKIKFTVKVKLTAQDNFMILARDELRGGKDLHFNTSQPYKRIL